MSAEVRDDELSLTAAGWKQRGNGRWVHTRFAEAGRRRLFTTEQAVEWQRAWDAEHEAAG